MNWLDILLIGIGITLFICGLIILVMGFVDDEKIIGIGMFISMLIFAFFVGILPFIIIDRESGSTIGTITSVDKNFFGTTAIYIKTSETEQEKYCIEDEGVTEQAKELIGKKVKIDYGTRVGLYSTGRCSSAPIEKIEEINKEN